VRRRFESCRGRKKNSWFETLPGRPLMHPFETVRLRSSGVPMFRSGHRETGAAARGWTRRNAIIGSDMEDDRGAGWRRDPTGRHQLRYHDGSTFTTYVYDNGIVGVDSDEAARNPTPVEPPFGGTRRKWLPRYQAGGVESDC
jgi:Protein of unknown function (DUF2510)